MAVNFDALKLKSTVIWPLWARLKAATATRAAVEEVAKKRNALLLPQYEPEPEPPASPMKPVRRP